MFKSSLIMAKKILFSLVLAVGAVALAVVGGEVLVRLLVPSSAGARWFVLDPKYGYVQRPNFTQEWYYARTNIRWEARFNSYGLRDREYDLQKPGVKRILLLGDSFTFGYGLNAEDTFDEVLERMLNESGTNEYQVLNAGVGGWGTIQEVLYALDHLKVFHPDAIVLTYCPNDQVDDTVYQQGAASGLLPSFPGKRFLRDHFRLYSFVYSCLETALFQRVLAADRSSASEVRMEGAYRVSNRRWQRTIKYIEALKQGFEEFDPRGLLLLQTTHPWDDDIRKHLESLADGEKVIYIDLQKAVERIGREHVFLSYDPHWTAEMHREAARLIYRALKEHRF